MGMGKRGRLIPERKMFRRSGMEQTMVGRMDLL
jgi:hypothetical protein